ncbi:chromosome transmission fidelity protein 8 [Entomortierella parvispora]|uniref:Chromosome transmission fidelity protein 8 n=1 Tax=Entomortierella parvispora TaxID=205924 RepID=A0A9P3H4V9_9FUNG|nr:chromosome transmission fidelity protein 8 [Entomortierella parvispora]
MVLISIPASASRNAPATTFATCCDTQSTIMLEFQGMIEMDGTTWAGNQLGQLSILDGGVKAQLVIGNHRLDGKVIKLDKPLLLIQKQRPSKDTVEDLSIPKTMNDEDYGNRRSSFDVRSSSPPWHGDHDNDDTMMSTGAGPTTDIEAMDPMAPSSIKDTVQYNTVAVIRQKILFNVMPVPIIHTERRGLTVIKRGV